MRKAFPGRPDDRTPGNSGDWRQTGGPRGRHDRGRVVVGEGIGHLGCDSKRHRPVGRCPKQKLKKEQPGGTYGRTFPEKLLSGLRARAVIMRQPARAIVLLLLQASTEALAQSCDANSNSLQRPLTLAELDKRQAELNKIKAAGYSFTEVKAAGYTLSEIRKAGYTAKDANYNGYTLKDAKYAGYTAKDAKDAGYTAKDVKDVGYTAKDAWGSYSDYINLPRVRDECKTKNNDLPESCFEWFPDRR